MNLLHPLIAGQKEDKWQAMWKMHGTCAGFDKQADYFGYALAAANKYNADVSVVMFTKWRLSCGTKSAPDRSQQVQRRCELLLHNVWRLLWRSTGPPTFRLCPSMRPAAPASCGLLK